MKYLFAFLLVLVLCLLLQVLLLENFLFFLLLALLKLHVRSKKAYKYSEYFECPIALIDKRRDGNDDRAIASTVIGDVNPF